MLPNILSCFLLMTLAWSFPALRRIGSTDLRAMNVSKSRSIISKEVEMHNARRMKEFSIDNILTEVMISNTTFY